MTSDLKILNIPYEHLLPFVPSPPEPLENREITIDKIKAIEPGKLFCGDIKAYRTKMDSEWSRAPMIFDHEGVWRIFSEMLAAHLGLQTDTKPFVEQSNACRDDQINRSSVDKTFRRDLILEICKLRPKAAAVLALLHKVHLVVRRLCFQSSLFNEAWTRYFVPKKFACDSVSVDSFTKLEISQEVLIHQLEQFARILYDAYYQLKKDEHGNTSFINAEEGILRGLFSVY